MAERPPEVFEAIDLRNHGVIEASAGTGKTYTVERIYYRILSEPHNTVAEGRFVGVEDILVVTYTDKAAGELKARIRQLLEDNVRAMRASGGERALIAHLEASLNGFDRAAIHTIHSFCKKNLDTFAFENRVGLQSELVDKASIAEKAFYRLARGPWKEWLFDDKAALDRLLEETGTGSLAKLRAVVCSLATRISSHKRDRLLPPPGIANNLELHPAFSREVLAALAAEMGRVYEALVAAAGRHTAAPESHPFYLAYERLETTLGIAKRSVTTGKKKLASCIALTGLSGEVETLMAWCAAASLNARTIASILTPAKRPRKEVVEAVGRVNGCPVDTLIDACIRLVELIDEYRLWHEARHYANEHAASFGPLVRMVRELRDHMRELMRGADQISYDDMIELVSDALAEPDSPLLRALRRQYLYGIIDEFQDTNALQWDIFRTIFLDGNNTDSEQRNVLYVVGDPKQSIFSFQGADIFTYLRARDEIAARGGACRELPANYRSSPAMIAAHNALFGGAAWFDRIHSRIGYTAVNAPAQSTVEDWPGAPVVLRKVEGGSPGDAMREYARWVVAKIRELVPAGVDAEGAGSSGSAGRAAVSLGDICVLVRKHAEAREIAERLARAAIPYSLYREEGVFQSDTCLHFIEMMESVAAPENDLKALKEALLTPFFDWPPHRLESLDPDADGHAEMRWYRRWRELRDRRMWPQLVRDLYATTGILARLALHPEAERLTADHRQIASYFLEHLVRERGSLHDAVRHLRGLYDQRIEPPEGAGRFEKETEAPRVRIMTIHASKGLGFPVVFLAGGTGREITRHDYLELRNPDGSTDYWVDTSPVTLKRHYYARTDDENRRLFYVALTRAARVMYLPVRHPAAEQPDILRKYRHASPSETFLSACLTAAARNDTGGLFHIDEQPVEAAGAGDRDPMETVRVLAPEEAAALLEDRSTVAPVVELAGRVHALSLGARYRCQTSYSALTHGRAVPHTLEGRQERSEEGERAEAAGVEATGPAEPEDLLPRGSHTGNMLHEVMERVSFEAVREMGSIEELCAYQPLRDIVSAALRRAAIPERDNLERTIAIVRHSLRAAFPDPAEPGATMRLCDVDDGRRACETEFHFAFDKQGRFGPGGEGGHVLGYIDLLFRRRDRYYVLDWKSNYLPSYTPDALARSMEESGYTIQKMLYALATDHWLSTRLKGYDFDRHFGGLIYCYLRGARENADTGFAVSRPVSRKALLRDYGRAIRERFLDNDKLRAILTAGER